MKHFYASSMIYIACNTFWTSFAVTRTVILINNNFTVDVEITWTVESLVIRMTGNVAFRLWMSTPPPQDFFQPLSGQWIEPVPGWVARFPAGHVLPAAARLLDPNLPSKEAQLHLSSHLSRLPLISWLPGCSM